MLVIAVILQDFFQLTHFFWVVACGSFLRVCSGLRKVGSLKAKTSKPINPQALSAACRGLFDCMYFDPSFLVQLLFKVFQVDLKVFFFAAL